MAAATVTTLGALKETLLGWTPPRAVDLARSVVLRIFSGLETGSLIIIDKAGEKHIFGQSYFDEDVEKTHVNSIDTAPKVEIVVKRSSFWLRLFLFADIGFAEGYMLGDFECSDLTSFFRVCTCPSTLYTNVGCSSHFALLLALHHKQGQAESWDDYTIYSFVNGLEARAISEYDC
jgi:hypothetical protein